MIDRQSIKNRLMQRLAEVSARAEHTRRQASHRDEAVPADFAEQAVERENDDVLNAISVESSQEALAIRQALSRLDEGDYGFCVKCGEEINEARLAALPEAAYCYACASKQELH